MLAQEFLKQLESEILGIESNVHGWCFRPYMLSAPEFVELKYSNGIICQVWVVLREAKEGYSVIFDPEEKEFGLVTGGIIVSSYNTFLETLNAM